MSPAGWPKGKPRTPLSPEHAKKFIAGAMRARARKREHAAEMSFTRQAVNASPAAWLKATANVGECQYLQNGLDETLLRALREGLVYASSVGYCHEPPLQEITIDVIAGVERHARKNSVPPRTHGLLKPFRKEGPVVVKKTPVVVTPVVTVVTPVMFSDRQRQIVAFIAAGISAEEAGERLGISPRTVKMHADKLRDKLHVRHRREVPLAYYELTGENVFDMLPPETPAVVEAPVSREGKGLLEVVSALFDPS